MKDRIKQFIKLEWQQIKPLQPENVKLPYNTGHLKKSLLKYGFSLPFYVWKSEGEYLCIDGHHRIDVLNELIAEGHKVPKQLNAVEIEAKDRKEAISILVDVMNQKSNPFAEEYLIEFLEVEQINIEDVNIESVNVVTNYHSSDIDLDSFFEENNEKKEQKNKIILEYTEEEFVLVTEALKKHSGSKEQIIYKLLGL